MAEPNCRAGLAGASFTGGSFGRNESKRQAPGVRCWSFVGRCHPGDGRETQVATTGRVQTDLGKQACARPRHSGRVQIHGSRACWLAEPIGRCNPWPRVAFSRRKGLTPQSRGLACGQPLTSNVSPLTQRPRTAVVEQSLSVSAAVLNTNTSAFQRWPQQALPAASTATAAQLVPSFTTHQACAAGPNKSGLPHTPVAQYLSCCRPPCQALQFRRRRCVGALRGWWERGAGSWFFLASFQVGTGSLFWSRLLVGSVRSLASNARLAKPAEMHWPASGRRALARLMANPSVKGTNCGEPQFAPYLER